MAFIALLGALLALFSFVPMMEIRGLVWLSIWPMFVHADGDVSPVRASVLLGEAVT